MIALVQETMISSFIVVHEMNTHLHLTYNYTLTVSDQNQHSFTIKLHKVHVSILNSALRGTDIFSGETTMY